jgi:hypothetical protein
MASISPKDIKLPPLHAPGKGVAEALNSATYMAKSATVSCTGGDTQPALLFNVPKDVFVEDVIVYTTTALTGASPDTLVVGIASDCDLFHASSDVLNVGSHSAAYGSALGAGGYVTSSDEQIEANWSTGTTAGAFYAVIKYKPRDSKNFVHNR